MANLWRVLALSWLSGVASPVLTGDMLPGEMQRPGAVPGLVVERRAETDALLEAVELSPGDADGLAGKTASGTPSGKA